MKPLLGLIVTTVVVAMLYVIGLVVISIFGRLSSNQNLPAKIAKYLYALVVLGTLGVSGYYGLQIYARADIGNAALLIALVVLPAPTVVGLGSVYTHAKLFKDASVSRTACPRCKSEMVDESLGMRTCYTCGHKWQ